MTPEGKVKGQVKKLLNEFSVYYHMPVMNGMGEPTLDFICCCNGKYLAIETKAPGKNLTPRQSVTAKHIAGSGGVVFMVATQPDLDALREWLMVEKATEALRR